jgi:flavodoxin/ferredoxin
MPKSLLVYYSLGGTTTRVAESVAAGLAAGGYEIDLCNLKDEQPPDAAGYDLLGVGSPAYYYRPPFIVQDYLDGLPDLHGLPVSVFVLHGTYPGDTGNIIRQALTHRGGREAGYFHCYGADFYLGYLKEGTLFSPDHPTPDELARAEEFGRQIAGVAAGEDGAQPGADPPPAFIYRLERFIANRWLVSQVYSRLFRVKGAECTACGICMQVCPTGNITGDPEGRPVWGRNCLLCLNCEMRCPQDAISSPATWPNMRPFMIYNVRRALRDPAIDRVGVIHRGGRTRRVPGEG